MALWEDEYFLTFNPLRTFTNFVLLICNKICCDQYLHKHLKSQTTVYIWPPVHMDGVTMYKVEVAIWLLAASGGWPLARGRRHSKSLNAQQIWPHIPGGHCWGGRMTRYNRGTTVYLWWDPPVRYQRGLAWHALSSPSKDLSWSRGARDGDLRWAWSRHHTARTHSVDEWEGKR